MGNDIGKLIREMRKAAGMSQMKLADNIGISYQQVQKYEKGASKLNVPRLTQIAKVFGVPVTAFIEDSNIPKSSRKKDSFSNFSDEEAKLLMLYRRLKRRHLKDGFLKMLGDMVRLSEGK
jgi:transcriptional regulator with XRE-family HTH domain